MCSNSGEALHEVYKRPSSSILGAWILHYILAEIEIAFSKSIYPGDDNLIPKDKKSIYSYSRIKEAFQGKIWQDIDLELVKKYKDDTVFFTPVGFYYYFPAFFIVALKHTNETDKLLENLLLLISPSRYQHLQQHLDAISVHFSNQQIRSIIDALHYLLDTIEDNTYFIPDLDSQLLQEAIRYWNQLIRI